MAEADNFLSRWSRRKALVRQGGPTPAEPATAQAPPELAPHAPAVAAMPALAPEPVPAAEAATPTVERPPPPTLDDVALLDRGSSYSRFVAPDVPLEVKNAALRKLFTDPHFNVMDGLDTYIEDYGLPDPLPASMLRQMASAHALGLFRDDSIPGPNAPRSATAPAGDPLPPQATADGDAPAAAPCLPADDLVDPAPPPPDAAHEDPDLRLQPNDAAGCTGAPPSAGEDAGCEH